LARIFGKVFRNGFLFKLGFKGLFGRPLPGKFLALVALDLAKLILTWGTGSNLGGPLGRRYPRFNKAGENTVFWLPDMGENPKPRIGGLYTQVFKKPHFSGNQTFLKGLIPKGGRATGFPH